MSDLKGNRRFSYAGVTRSAAEILDAYLPPAIRIKGSCWNWDGPMLNKGYGNLDHAGKKWLAHRFVYEQLVGPIPAGKDLRHSCDNPPCCNPEHLTPGTHAENMADMAGRDRQQRGSRNRHAKLNEDQVVEIRRIYGQGGVTITDLARLYGVGQPSMSRLLSGHNWRHVPMEASL